LGEWEFHSREWNPDDFPKPGLETPTLRLGVHLSDVVVALAKQKTANTA